MGLKFKEVIAAIVIIGLFSIAEGAWQGPSEIVSGTWGSNDDQFGIKHGDANDVFGGPYYILGDGGLIVTDLVNGRKKIYGSNGSISKIVKCVKNQAGQWNDECRIPLADYTQTTLDGNIWVGPLEYLKQQGYSLYSPTGQLIGTSTMKPVELGDVTKSSLSNGSSRYVVKYQERTYFIETINILDKVVGDSNGYVYGVSKVDSGEEFWTYQVSKYSTCGKEIGLLKLPPKRLTPKVVERQKYGIVERRRQVIDEFGQPIIAPAGDVYIWKRTPDKYFILKWAWVDDPNSPSGPDAPSGLNVAPSTSGLYLTWTASPQDPGCVTNYEIARATTAGGVTETVATVNAGVLKYNDTTATAGTTYYYKVRAKAGSEYSAYTSEISGKR